MLCSAVFIYRTAVKDQAGREDGKILSAGIDIPGEFERGFRGVVIVGSQGFGLVILAAGIDGDLVVGVPGERRLVVNAGLGGGQFAAVGKDVGDIILLDGRLVFLNGLHRFLGAGCEPTDGCSGDIEINSFHGASTVKGC